MIIESACNIAPLKLPDYPDWENGREEEFSRVIASNCEMILSGLGVPYPHRFIQVEVRYSPTTSERCDIVIDNSKISNFPLELSHKEYVECKFFRTNRTGGNSSNLAGSLWKDFRKVISQGNGFPYSIVLCEKKYKNVLPSSGIHQSCIDKCFDISSASSFSLWEKFNFDFTKDNPFELTASAGHLEIQVIRSFTEAFTLKFGLEERLYRIFIFKLYSKDSSCQAFEF